MTTATLQIANSLNIIETAIVRIEEWANVFFVVAKGIGGRFVSKKVVKVVKEEKNMNLTVDRIAWALRKLPSLNAKVWKKHGLERVYITGGYLDIDSLGNLNRIGHHVHEGRCPVSFDAINNVISNADYAEFELNNNHNNYRDSHSSTENALNAMYGKGGWDDRDREDYEG
jgi:hypothetical protein